jgi:hypothetical protein
VWIGFFWLWLAFANTIIKIKFYESWNFLDPTSKCYFLEKECSLLADSHRQNKLQSFRTVTTCESTAPYSLITVSVDCGFEVKEESRRRPVMDGHDVIRGTWCRTGQCNKGAAINGKSPFI